MERRQISLFADDIILCIRDIKNSTGKLLEIINTRQSVGIPDQLTKLSNYFIYQQ